MSAIAYLHLCIKLGSDEGIKPKQEKTSLPGLSHCSCLALWIGCVTPNVLSAGSTPPKVKTENYNWVAPSWLVYLLHLSHCLFEFI